MVSIGEIAGSTGVSRRMLRHWEDLGLLEPADVDPVTRYRSYAPTQVGRVRAVAALRELGLGLGDIAVLLDPSLGRGSLVEVLRAHERALEEQVSAAATRLARVRERLSAIERGSSAMSTLVHQSLPALRLVGLHTQVLDETEIPAAATDLRARLRTVLGDVEGRLVLAFDGTDDDVVVVSAGVPDDVGASARGLVPLTVDEAEQGVSVRFDELPRDASDAWVLVDHHLEAAGLRTWGVHRHVHAADGSVTLQAATCTRT
ncbi:MerR family transcriptional regulator [Pseudokineococcus sp. 1T1Z-3]|uniref:MerR family transcriptional regulator n=1 Tax=Pseudokineococcus sp. 1T1Z-3 TaxID=3132745 RepID=UPI00309F18D6